MSTAEIMSRGMEALIEKMGIVDAESFIAIVIREQMDYTAWQREYFDAMEPGEVTRKALEFARNHPYTGDATRI